MMFVGANEFLELLDFADRVFHLGKSLGDFLLQSFFGSAKLIGDDGGNSGIELGGKLGPERRVKPHVRPS